MDYLLSGKYQIDFGSATWAGTCGHTDDHGVFFRPQGRLFALSSGCPADIYGFTPAELCVDAVRAYLDHAGDADRIPMLLRGSLSFANYVLRASANASAVSTLTLAFIDEERRLFHGGSGGLWLHRKSGLHCIAPNTPPGLGIEWNYSADASQHPMQLFEEDRLLLASGALSKALEEGVILDILSAGGDAQETADKLVRAAGDAVLRDGVTVQVVALGSAE